MTLKSLLSILIFVALISCNYGRNKPSTVPKEAIWKGGRDGGCWILFNSISDTTIEATVFYENGENWDKGIFKKVGDCSVDSSKIIKDIIGFDGQNLLTSKGCSFRK